MDRKTLQNVEDEIYASLKDLRGPELIRSLAQQLSKINSAVERLDTKLKLLDAYEEQRNILLSVDEPVSAEQGEWAPVYALDANDFLLLDAGFHGIEYNTDGDAYRWAGANGGLAFDPVVDRSQPLAVTLTLIGTVDPSNYDGIMLFDGEVEIPVEVVRIPKRNEIRAVLPAREGHKTTHLLYKVPVCRKLSEEDARQAGVAFYSLAIKPTKTEG